MGGVWVWGFFWGGDPHLLAANFCAMNPPGICVTM